MLRLYPSDPLYHEVNYLFDLYAKAINAHVFTDLAWLCQTPEPERHAFTAALYAELSGEFDEWVEWVRVRDVFRVEERTR